MNESIGYHFLVLVYNLQVLMFNSYSLKGHFKSSTTCIHWSLGCCQLNHEKENKDLRVEGFYNNEMECVLGIEKMKEV